VIQIIILILSAASIWLVTREEDWKKYGYIIGLLSQPFWAYSSFVNEQWGIFALTLFYTYSWSQGIYNYFIKIKTNELI